jgi:hypothetical protein
MVAKTESSADKRVADEKKKLADERSARQKAREEHLKQVTGRPTPTQDEADQAKLGLHPELEPDGSTDPYAPPHNEAKQMESGKPSSSYQNRSLGAAHHRETSE